MQGDEFFIGYDPPVPPRLAHFVRRVVVGAAGTLAVWVIVLAAGHVQLQGGTFEFGHPRTVSGRIVERPYPSLQLDATGGSTPPSLLLVAPGKHGADDLVHGLDGRFVTLAGTRIQRGSFAMLEVEPTSIRPSSPATAGGADSRAAAANEVELQGEIVDSKCFLGVMVPGEGKTHRDCASLCIRGGIPPALHVRNHIGESSLFLLTGSSGESIREAALRSAGERILMNGAVVTEHGWSALRTDPSRWHRP